MARISARSIRSTLNCICLVGFISLLILNDCMLLHCLIFFTSNGPSCSLVVVGLVELQGYLQGGSLVELQGYLQGVGHVYVWTQELVYCQAHQGLVDCHHHWEGLVGCLEY